MAEKKATKSIDGDIITFNFAEGGELTADLAKVPQEIIHRLAMHGFSQKLGDSYAGSEVSEAFGRAEGVLKDLYEGNWSVRVAAGSPRTTQLAEALAAATGKQVDEAVALLETMDDEAKKTLRKHPQIKGELAQIKANNAAAEAKKAAEAASSAEPLQL